MARPQRSRKICIEPKYKLFGPLSFDFSGMDTGNTREQSADGDQLRSEASQTTSSLGNGVNAGCIELTLDEYESIRLIDRVGLTQELCARHMGVSRTTVTQIYDNARRKLSEMLVSGMPLTIQGGHYMVCNGHAPDNDGGMCSFCRDSGERLN